MFRQQSITSVPHIACIADIDRYSGEIFLLTRLRIDHGGTLLLYFNAHAAISPAVEILLRTLRTYWRGFPPYINTYFSNFSSDGYFCYYRYYYEIFISI